MSAVNVAIIGANGFIGRHLTEALLQKKGVQLFLFGKSEKSSFGNVLPYTQLNLLDGAQIKTQFASIDIVYYLASESIPATSWEDPLMEIEKNLKPFIFFSETLSKLKAKKIVFVSSAGTVYGPAEEKVKEDSATKPFSPYGIIKLTMENFLSYFEKKYDLHFDIYRVSNVYGDGQDTSKGLGIINTFLEKIITEKRITIFGNGQSIRNYVYVKDVAELMSLSISSDTSVSNVYNLASNDTLSINNLVALMQKTVSEKFEVIYKETRQSDNPTIDLDNTKLLNAYSQFRLTSIEDGIAKTYSFIKKNTIKI